MVRSGVLGGEQRVAGRQRRVVGVVGVRRRVDQLVRGLAGRQQAGGRARAAAVQQPRLRAGRARHARRQNQRSPERGLSAQGHSPHAPSRR